MNSTDTARTGTETAGREAGASAAENALHSPELHQLVASKNKVSLSLTIAMLVLYFGFIFLIAFRKEVLGAKISAHATLGVPLGIGVILAAWGLTGLYVRWANSKYDGMVESLRGKWGK